MALAAAFAEVARGGMAGLAELSAVQLEERAEDRAAKEGLGWLEPRGSLIHCALDSQRRNRGD